MARDNTDGGRDIGAEIDALRTEVAELRDKEAIRERLGRYVFLLDSSRWRDVPAEIFTEDAIDYHLPEIDPPVIAQGREELMEFLDEVMPTFIASQHFLGNSHIEVNGEQASSRTYQLASHWDGDDPGHADTFACAFDDKWRRTEDGWRIYERRLHRFGPSGLVTGKLLPGQPRIGTDLYGARDR